MNCILKSCSVEACSQCEAAAMLDLSRRNDGYLARICSNPTLRALREAGMISTAPACDGYVLVRAVPNVSKSRPVTIGYHGNRLLHDDRGRWCGASA